MSTDKTGLLVNLFIGSRIHVGEVAGTNVEWFRRLTIRGMEQIAITVNPEQAKTFSVYVRIPNRNTSKLYTESPAIHGVKRFAVNGKHMSPRIENGRRAKVESKVWIYPVNSS